MRIFGAVELVEEPRFGEAELEGAEFAGQERDDGGDGGGRDEERVDAVDYAVGAEDVDGDELAVEVDGGAFEGYADGEALRVAEVLLGLKKRRNCV